MARRCSVAFWALVFTLLLLPYKARLLPSDAGAVVVASGFLYLLPSRKWGLVLVYLVSVVVSVWVLTAPFVLFLGALAVEDLNPATVLCLGYPAYREAAEGGAFIVHDVFLREVDVFVVLDDGVVFDWGPCLSMMWCGSSCAWGGRGRFLTCCEVFMKKLLYGSLLLCHRRWCK